jgi:hypothetical protein
VIAAAEAEDAPVMLQSYFGDHYYGGLDVLPQLLRILAEQSSGRQRGKRGGCNGHNL